jgi:hypothetical protein
MRTFCTWVVILAAVGSVAAEEEAKPDVPETTSAELVLLRQKSVQKELKLSDEDVKKVLEFTNKESEDYGKALKLTPAERRAKVEELEKKNVKFLKDTLSAEQLKRLIQITYQVTGAYQLTRPEAARALSLTDEQQAKFKELEKEAHKDLLAIVNSTDRATKNAKLAKLREAINKKIETLLTDEQKTKARELVGEPFKGEILFEEPE